MSEVTILVNSCDLYEDAWDPFFKLLKIQWPDCPYRIVLNTETKKYNCNFMSVETICGGKDVPWAKRLKNALSKIESDYILYFLEDFFLMSPVSTESFDKALSLMKSDPLVGYIGLKYNKEHRFIDKNITKSDLPFLNKDELVKANRVNSMTALWRKDWLESLIRVHETPWEFEKYASIRSKRTDKKVLIINNSVLAPVFHYEIDFKYGYGISMKKWLPKNKELFEKYRIQANFDSLGFMDENTYNGMVAYSENNGSDKKKKVKAKFDSKECLYNIKKSIKKMPKRINKKIRKIRSLI